MKIQVLLTIELDSENEKDYFVENFIESEISCGICTEYYNIIQAEIVDESLKS